MSLSSLRKQIARQLTGRQLELAQRWQEKRAVRLEERDEDEIRLTVRPPGHTGSFEVYIWPDDEDSDCSCGQDNCLHRYVALQALTLEEAGGPRLPTAKKKPRVIYELHRVGRLELGLRAVKRAEGRPQAIQRPWSKAGVYLTREDQHLERALEGCRRPNTALWEAILKNWWRSGAEILFEGRSLRATPKALRQQVVVDQSKGLRLSLRRNPGVDEVLTPDLQRVGDTLQQTPRPHLSAELRQKLVRGWRVAPHEQEEVFTRWLPFLKKHFEIITVGGELPQTIEAALHAQLETRRTSLGMEVRVCLAYGHPPMAILEREGWTRLGQDWPTRDTKAERKLSDTLSRELGLPCGRWVERRGDEGPLFLQRWKRLEAQGEFPLRRGQLELGSQLREQPPSLRWVEAEGGLGIRLSTDADPRDLLEAWGAGRRWVLMQDRSLAPLPRDLLQGYGSALSSLLRTEGEGGVPEHALGMVMELEDQLELPRTPRLEQLRPLLSEFEGIPEIPPPPELRAALRPYQQEGLDWLSFLRGAGLSGILADDMGLGKTLQALCAIRLAGGRSLIVAPTSVLSSWREQAQRFLPELRVCLYHGGSRRLDQDAELVITSYGILRQEAELAQRDWTYAVLDEAQAIKNPRSQTAQAAFQIRARHRLSLTGTPVENRLEELWAQMHFLQPGLLGTPRSFQAEIAGPIRAGSQRAAQQLRARIRPFILRRLKAEVAPDLPPRTEMLLRCDPTPSQQAVYESLEAEGREAALQQLAQSKTLEVLSHLLRLRQASCDQDLLPDETVSWQEGSGKIRVLMEHLQQLIPQGHRCLVFSQWTSFLDRIQLGLEEQEIGYLRLDGSTRDRQALVDRFQSESGPPVFLISLKAGGTGLTLTAADYVFLMDPWWNPAAEAQATDRAHRIGQERPVVAVKIITEGTVEERILKLQERKRALAEAALGGEGALAQTLTREDLQALLG